MRILGRDFLASKKRVESCEERIGYLFGLEKSYDHFKQICTGISCRGRRSRHYVAYQFPRTAALGADCAKRTASHHAGRAALSGTILKSQQNGSWLVSNRILLRIYDTTRSGISEAMNL
jgi:hypothetical protein